MKPKLLTKKQAKSLMKILGEDLESFKPLVDKEVIIYRKINGQNGQRIWNTLSRRVQRNIMRQAISYVEEMQQFEFDKIGSLYGEKVERVINTQKGPFKNLNTFLLSEYDKCLTDMKLPIKTKFEQFRQELKKYSSELPYVFTHGDLGPKNLLIDRNKVVGVIDWEWSGSAPGFLDLEELDWCDNDLVNKSSIKQDYPRKLIDIRNMVSNAMRCAYYKDWNIKNEKAYLENVYKNVEEIMKKYN